MRLAGSRAGTLGVVAAALAATAGWLRIGPGIASSLAGDGSPALSEALFTLVMFGPLLAGGIAGAALSGLSTGRAGRSPMSAGVKGAAIGIGGVSLATGYAALAGTMQRGAGDSLSLALLVGVAVIALQVAAEESLFRSWLQPLLAGVTGIPLAIGCIAVAFAAMHLLAGAHDAVALVNLTLGGVLFGVLAARGGGIAGAFAAHFAWNATEQLVFGLDPNPGIGSFGAIIDLDMAGAIRWGGSGDGLNASWAMGIALCAILVPLMMRRRRSAADAMTQPSAHCAALNPSIRRPT